MSLLPLAMIGPRLPPALLVLLALLSATPMAGADAAPVAAPAPDTGTGAGGASAPAGVAIAEPALREVTLTGFTRPRARLPLVAEVAGTIVAVGYDIGDTIGADGTFARIDDTFIRLDLDLLATREAQLRSQIEYDQREVARYSRLARENNAAVTQLDSAEQALRNNRHELERLAVERAILQERQRRTRIEAPRGWQVSARTIEPGQRVAAYEQVGTVVDLYTIVVPFALTPEQHAVLSRQAATAAGVALVLPDLDRTLAAMPVRSNPDFDEVTRKITVELALREPDTPGDAAVGQPRRGGLRALLRLPMPERSGAVLLPPAAVRRSLEEYWVDPLDGDPIRVLVLGEHDGAAGPRLRVSGNGLAVGDRVRLQP